MLDGLRTLDCSAVRRGDTLPAVRRCDALVRLERAEIRAPGAIRGRVVDLGGSPVAGASVCLVPPPSHWGQQGLTDVRSVHDTRATTGADGTFALAALPEAYGVLVTHPDFVPFHAPRVVAPRDESGRALPDPALGDGPSSQRRNANVTRATSGGHPR